MYACMLANLHSCSSDDDDVVDFFLFCSGSGERTFIKKYPSSQARLSSKLACSFDCTMLPCPKLQVLKISHKKCSVTITINRTFCEPESSSYVQTNILANCRMENKNFHIRPTYRKTGQNPVYLISISGSRSSKGLRFFRWVVLLMKKPHKIVPFLYLNMWAK